LKIFFNFVYDIHASVYLFEAAKGDMEDEPP